LGKIQKCTRPVTEIYGDFVERRKGRFEIIPPKQIETKIWKILFKNNKFVKTNQEITNIIKKNYKGCVQELGILPVESHTKNGIWHRDILLIILRLILLNLLFILLKLFILTINPILNFV